MKKAFAIVITAVLVCVIGLGVYYGYRQAHPEKFRPKPTGVSCQVMSLEEDGMIVYMPDIKDGEGNYTAQYVYVKTAKIDPEIRTLHTVIIEFSESDLKPESGSFIDAFDYERSYSYILEKPKSLRLTEPGEPTYG